MPKENRENMQSNYFRILYANVFSIRFSNEEFQVTFSVDYDEAESGKIVMDEAKVVMTPRAAKIFSILLGKSVEHFEKTSGSISVTDEKQNELEKSFEKALETSSQE